MSIKKIRHSPPKGSSSPLTSSPWDYHVGGFVPSQGLIRRVTLDHNLYQIRSWLSARTANLYNRSTARYPRGSGTVPVSAHNISLCPQEYGRCNRELYSSTNGGRGYSPDESLQWDETTHITFL